MAEGVVDVVENISAPPVSNVIPEEKVIILLPKLL